MIDVVTIILFVLLVAVAIAIAYTRDLFAAVMLSGIFSLLCASLYVIMDAVDVAFTEAAVGAGISTVLMLIVLNLTSDKESKPVEVKVFPLVVALCMGAALIYATGDMPAYGQADTPLHQGDTGQYYIHQSFGDSHIPNSVTTILASYRGYDTLGETTVVFTAAVAVLLLLGRAIPRKSVLHAVKSDSVALVGAKMLIPYIILFALYVQFHGDFGPGGGFQAGVMFAAAFILHGMVRSLRHTRDAAPSGAIERLIAFGVLLYGGTGIVCMLKGGNFLEYNVLAHDPIHGQHYGIIAIELGVGIAVFSAMVAIFYKFALRGRP